MKAFSTERGVGVLEVLIGVAVLAISFISITSAFGMAVKIGLGNTKHVQASYLLEEGIEAGKLLRDISWASTTELTAGTEYGIEFFGSGWRATTTAAGVVGDFTRTLRFDDVYRDGDEDIVSSGGTLDAGTRMLTVTVSWAELGTTTSKSVSTYVADIFE